ncbi:hypothetical protein AVEN_82140-1 [Araneus ventricosus]|uniref:Uncharacterized protein n=1 Tax=Araneus ventricosus TaxID=182803 RepID=A0A4Y2MVQ9_ARAVE|nr:hypothetical protein AVEN_19255-1 [Araneus ventricosus]GBN38714.1 hypothetical protein AVEN_82140-1 [Araneus ventricosus]
MIKYRYSNYKRNEVNTDESQLHDHSSRHRSACTSETQWNYFTVLSARLYNAAKDLFRSYGYSLANYGKFVDAITGCCCVGVQKVTLMTRSAQFRFRQPQCEPLGGEREMDEFSGTH